MNLWLKLVDKLFDLKRANLLTYSFTSVLEAYFSESVSLSSTQLKIIKFMIKLMSCDLVVPPLVAAIKCKMGQPGITKASLVPRPSCL